MMSMRHHLSVSPRLSTNRSKRNPYFIDGKSSHARTSSLGTIPPIPMASVSPDFLLSSPSATEGKHVMFSDSAMPRTAFQYDHNLHPLDPPLYQHQQSQPTSPPFQVEESPLQTALSPSNLWYRGDTWRTEATDLLSEISGDSVINDDFDKKMDDILDALNHVPLQKDKGKSPSSRRSSKSSKKSPTIKSPMSSSPIKSPFSNSTPTQLQLKPIPSGSPVTPLLSSPQKNVTLNLGHFPSISGIPEDKERSLDPSLLDKITAINMKDEMDDQEEESSMVQKMEVSDYETEDESDSENESDSDRDDEEVERLKMTMAEMQKVIKEYEIKERQWNEERLALTTEINEYREQLSSQIEVQPDFVAFTPAADSDHGDSDVTEVDEETALTVMLEPQSQKPIRIRKGRRDLNQKENRSFWDKLFFCGI